MPKSALLLLCASLALGLAAQDSDQDGQEALVAQEPATPQIIFIPGINDAPLLDTSKNPWLTPQRMNDPVPAGAVGTLVTQLVDFSLPVGQVDNVTDADSTDGDPAPVTGIAVTAADATNGTWYYSINNGTVWSLLGTPTNTSARLLAADGNCRLYFRPVAGFSGVTSSAITFRAWDRTTGTIGGLATTASSGGTTAFSTATDTASLSLGVIYRGLSTDIDAGGGPSATLTILQPAGTAVNDVMFATLAVRPETATLIPPTGWSLLRRVDNPATSPLSLASYYHVAGVAEPASTDWTAQVPAGSVGGFVGGLQSWSGISNGNPVDVQAGSATPSSLSHTAPSVTATVGNTIFFTGFAFGSAATWTPPSTSPTTFEIIDLMSQGGPGSTGISLSVDVQTLAATGSTGIRTATASNDADAGTTMSFVVRPVTNSAPVLDASKTPVLGAETEDPGAPAGAVGTLISSLVDFVNPPGQVDNVTDPDPGALLGIALTATDTANGAWFYSTNGGGTWLPVGAVSHASALALAADASTRLYFQPSANFNGILPTALTFRAWDRTSDTSGARATVAENGGRTAFSTETDTADITVFPVNDPPAGTDKTVTALEDSVYTFAAADFGFTDPNDSPANSLQAVKITTLPGAGALRLSGVAVTAGQFIAAASLVTLTFTPGANASGVSYTSFTFQVQDNGGIANGGIDLDPTPNTLTVNVTAVNDAPAGTDKTVAALEDSIYSFAVADFGFTDPNDSPSNSLTAVKITTLPATGSLRLSGFAVTAGQFIAAASLGTLTFTPALNANGASYASFTFQVQDNGGVANGGVDLDASPNMITVNVISVNDPPAGTDRTAATPEDTAYNFAASDFGFTDPNDSPSNSLLTVKITTLPAAGVLQLSGFGVTPGQFIPVASITAGNLNYIPGTNGNGAPYASFTFQVQDNGGSTNGGLDLDPTANTLTINVTPVNDSPVAVNDAASTPRDTQLILAASALLANDSDVDLNPVTVISVQSAVNGSVVIAGGTVYFTPSAGYTGPASFTYTISDGNGGTATATVIVTVTAVPVGRVPDGTTGSPLRLAINSGDASKLDLNWAASCGAAGTDYAVYQGTIGSWYSHAPLLCTTAGALTATVTPAAGSRYYLIVPLSATLEGSYGTNSAGAEIPVLAGACRAGQDLPSCP